MIAFLRKVNYVYPLLILGIFAIVGSCELRNRYYHSLLGREYQKLNSAGTKLPVGLQYVYDSEGAHVGYFRWPLGPFEYRDKYSGEWRWTE